MSANKASCTLIDYRPFAESPKFKGSDKLLKVESVKNMIKPVAGEFITEIRANDLINIGVDVTIRQARNADF